MKLRERLDVKGSLKPQNGASYIMNILSQNFVNRASGLASGEGARGLINACIEFNPYLIDIEISWSLNFVPKQI